MIKALPRELTSYDLLKAFAIILMITDHVGHHFFPDEVWFRVIGRLCIPIWFFLIGYAKTTDIPNRLWIGGVIVAASAIISGQFLFPLNILFTMIVLRWFRQKRIERCLYSADGLRGMFFILIFLAYPTAILFEYGASAFLFMMIGYIVRNKEGLYEKVEPRYTKMFAIASFLIFFFMQGAGMREISLTQSWFMFSGFIVIGLALWNFRSVVYVDADRYMAPSLIRMLQFLGRRTLEIYVVHIVVFRGISMYLYPDKYSFMAWGFAPSSLVSMFT